MNIFSTLSKTHQYDKYLEAERFANSIPEETWNKMSNMLFKNSVLENCHNLRIRGLSKDFFQKEQVFYHGENPYQKQKTYEDGNLIWCEELGDGLYISSRKKVAAFFAGLRGKTYFLKLNTDKIAQVNRKQIKGMVNVIADNADGFWENPTGERLNVIIRMLFQKNGYDAAYTGRSIGEAFGNAGTFFDTAIGEPEKQLAVYNLDIIEVLPKSLKDRVENQILQTKGHFRYHYERLKFKYGWIQNYTKVDDFLSRSAELRLFDIDWLKKKKVTDIIDFRQGNEMAHMNYNELEYANSKGIVYHNLPTDPDNIEENIEKYLEIITNAKKNGGKVHIHCREGCDRTGFYTYIYERLFNKTPKEEAYKNLISGGWHHSEYPDIPELAETYVQKNNTRCIV